MFRSEEIIEALVDSLQADASQRDRHIYREALRTLVRLAKIEQIVALQEDFQVIERMAGRPASFPHRPKSN